MERYSKSSDIIQTRALLLERLNHLYPYRRTLVEDSHAYPYSISDYESNDLHFRTDIDGTQIDLTISLYDTLGVVTSGGYDDLHNKVVLDIQKEVDNIYLNYV